MGPTLRIANRDSVRSCPVPLETGVGVPPKQRTQSHLAGLRQQVQPKVRRVNCVGLFDDQVAVLIEAPPRPRERKSLRVGQECGCATLRESAGSGTFAARCVPTTERVAEFEEGLQSDQGPECKRVAMELVLMGVSLDAVPRFWRNTIFRYVC